MAKKLYAQGDIVLQLIEDVEPTGSPLSRDADGAVILARGELTGHRHVLYGDAVTLFRDDGLARSVPPTLYVGHVKISAPFAELRHEEHATIKLPAGTYCARRQQEWEGEAPELVLE